MKIKRHFKKWVILSTIFALLSGCSQPLSVNQPAEATPADQFEMVRKAADDYLSGTKVQTISPQELYVESVQKKNPNYYLVDIRANEDFLTKNIRGSVNIPYAQTVNLKKLENLPKDKILVVIDYNGHWAAQTAATWNMLGFKAVPLRYRIQSWTKEEGPAGYELFPEKPLDYALVDQENVLGDYQLPELKMPEDRAEEIIRLLSGTYLARNYKGFISAEDLMTAIKGRS
jgi:rhodanese-related sulfurtransferase